jgi:hypothetical protein
MHQARSLIVTINLISVLLISEPLLKVLVLKTQSGLEWSLIWSNIIENSQTFGRFFLFWLISPLTGIFLLTYSRLAYALYFLLSFFKIYQIMSFTPYSWPYMTKHPHVSALLFEVVNFALLLYLLYPILQRFILSRYLRNYWDARGRVDCSYQAFFFAEGVNEPVQGTIANISSGGVSLEIDDSNADSIEAGKLVFYDHQGTPLSFDVKTKSKRGQANQMILGMEFIGLSPKEKIYLRASLQNKMAEEEYLSPTC